MPLLQLYNLVEDPREPKNLQDKYPEKVTELVDALVNAITDGRTTAGPQQSNEGWPNTIPQALLKKFPQLTAPNK